jgi:O-antigen/teichoic acid export membrane protein
MSHGSRLTSSATQDSPFGDHAATAGAHVFRGSLWTLAGSLAPYAYTTFVSIVAARVLGPSGMGRQSFISFVVLTTMTLCSAGFPLGITRYIGEIIGRRREDLIPSLVFWSWRVELAAGSIGSGALLAAAALGATPRAAWTFGAVAVLAGVLHKVPASVLNGTQRWRQNSVITLVTGGATAAATTAALLAGAGITGIFVALAAANVSMLVWASVIVRRLVRRIQVRPKPLGTVGREILRFSLAASVPVLLTFLVYQKSEFFFLEHYSSNRQIALYSIAFSAYAALAAFPAALASIVTPAVATLFGSGALDRIRAGYGRALRLLISVSIPLTAATFVLGPPLLRIVYGAAYAGTGKILLVLAAPLLVVPIGGLSSGLLVGYGRIRVPVLVGVVSASLDIGLAALLVPGMAAMGAAIANIAAQLASAIISISFALRTVGRVEIAPRHLAKTMIASVTAAGCARLVLEMGQGGGLFLLSLAAGVAIFAAIAMSLGILPREDAEWLARGAGARGGRRLGLLCLRLSGKPLDAVN